MGEVRCAVRGVETRVPQAVPPGTSEASFPSMEHYVMDLPSKDYFLKTLDRPHYPDGVGMDNRGNPIDDQGHRIDRHGNELDEKGNPGKPVQPQQQVSNTAPATLASAEKP